MLLDIYPPRENREIVDMRFWMYAKMIRSCLLSICVSMLIITR